MGSGANVPPAALGGGAGGARAPATPVMDNLAEAAASAAVVPAKETVQSDDELLSDMDSGTDITGALSDGEPPRMDVDIEAVVARVPQAQRAGVRAALEKRKTKMAKKHSHRLKKPLVEETGVPRNSKKL